jgi:hypothetical protein
LAEASWDLREEGFELAAEAGRESTGAVCIFVERSLREKLMRRESESAFNKGCKKRAQREVVRFRLTRIYVATWDDDIL